MPDVPALDVPALDVPRSVRLAAWAGAVLRGRARVDDAVRAVTGGDEPHAVETGDDDDDGGGGPHAADRPIPTGVADLTGVADPTGVDDLTGLLSTWLRNGVTGLAVRLPVPGDVLGLPGPAEFNRAALDAGECVVTDAVPGGGGRGSGRVWGAVPRVEVFGSSWERGYLVTWTVRAVQARTVADLAGVVEADQALRLAMSEAAEELARLDVARWRPDAAARLSGIRDGGLPRDALPSDVPARCARVVATAVRLRAVLRLAREDDGAAVSGYEAQRRDETLRRLDGVARRALVAAVNGIGEGG